MEPILKFEQVSKDYPNGVHALKNVSFQVKEGEFISIIGPSGSGKSTLLRAINRLIPISGGSLWLDGQEVSRQRGQNLRKLRRKVGMIFQNYNLVYSLSVLHKDLSHSPCEIALNLIHKFHRLYDGEHLTFFYAVADFYIRLCVLCRGSIESPDER